MLEDVWSAAIFTFSTHVFTDFYLNWLNTKNTWSNNPVPNTHVTTITKYLKYFVTCTNTQYVKHEHIHKFSNCLRIRTVPYWIFHNTLLLLKLGTCHTNNIVAWRLVCMHTNMGLSHVPINTINREEGLVYKEDWEWVQSKEPNLYFGIESNNNYDLQVVSETPANKGWKYETELTQSVSKNMSDFIFKPPKLVQISLRCHIVD